MECRKCSKWSYGHDRCLDGKSNPRKRRAVYEIIKLMGPSVICGKNEWKGEVVEQLFYELEDRERRENPDGRESGGGFVEPHEYEGRRIERDL